MPQEATDIEHIIQTNLALSVLSATLFNGIPFRPELLSTPTTPKEGELLTTEILANIQTLLRWSSDLSIHQRSFLNFRLPKKIISLTPVEIRALHTIIMDKGFRQRTNFDTRKFMYEFTAGASGHNEQCGSDEVSQMKLAISDAAWQHQPQANKLYAFVQEAIYDYSLKLALSRTPVATESAQENRTSDTHSE